jgi:hypothetical protein
MTIYESDGGSLSKDIVVRLTINLASPHETVPFGMLTCVILGKRFGYCNYSHISFTARIIAAVSKTPAETDAASGRRGDRQMCSVTIRAGGSQLRPR